MVRPRIVIWSEKVRQTCRRGLDALPSRFRKRMRNVSVLVENVPPEQLHIGLAVCRDPDADDADSLVSVSSRAYHTRKSVFDVPSGPDRIVLYQRTSRPSAPMKTNPPGSPSDSDPRTRALFWDDRNSVGRRVSHMWCLVEQV